MRQTMESDPPQQQVVRAVAVGPHGKRARPMPTQMDRILFGDNQFFGVNHMSEEKARTQSMRFQDIARDHRGPR